MDWGSLTTVLQFVLRQWAKAEIHTAMPGLVETYDPATRRARVRAALRLVTTTDTPGVDGDPMDRAPIVNVPVIFPSGGGFTMTFPLPEGSPVLLVMSERGVGDFKRTFEEANPTRGHFFAESDAMAIPGFGPLTVTPFDEEGATLQRDDGTAAVSVRSDRIDIHVASGQHVNIGGPGGEELVTRSFLSTFYNTHVHLVGATPSMPPTVQAPVTPGTDLTRKLKAE